MPETPSPGGPEHVPITTQQLISEHVALVGYVVSEISMRLPTYVDRDDLRSAGLEGLVQASRGFSES